MKCRLTTPPPRRPRQSCLFLAVRDDYYIQENGDDP
jgi:hypothetical protein